MHSATQRAAVSALRSVLSSGGSHSVRSITRARLSCASSRDGAEEIRDRASRPAAHRARRASARGRSRRCRSRRPSPRSARHVPSARPIASSIPSRRTSAMRDHQIAALRPRRGASRAVLAKRARPICAMFAPGQAVLDQARTGLPLLRPSVGVAHVEMRVERDQPDLVERQAERRARPGRVTALLPPIRGSAHARRRSPRPRRGSDAVASSIDSPATRHRRGRAASVDSSRPVSTS